MAHYDGFNCHSDIYLMKLNDMISFQLREWSFSIDGGKISSSLLIGFLPKALQSLRLSAFAEDTLLGALNRIQCLEESSFTSFSWSVCIFFRLPTMRSLESLLG